VRDFVRSPNDAVKVSIKLVFATLAPFSSQKKKFTVVNKTEKKVACVSSPAWACRLRT